MEIWLNFHVSMLCCFCDSSFKRAIKTMPQYCIEFILSPIFSLFFSLSEICGATVIPISESGITLEAAAQTTHGHQFLLSSK